MRRTKGYFRVYAPPRFYNTKPVSWRRAADRTHAHKNTPPLTRRSSKIRSPDQEHIYKESPAVSGYKSSLFFTWGFHLCRAPIGWRETDLELKVRTDVNCLPGDRRFSGLWVVFFCCLVMRGEGS
jgi:hypothetical protein